MACLPCNSITPDNSQIMHSIAALCLSLNSLGTASLPSAAGTLSWKGPWPCGSSTPADLGPGHRCARDSMLPDPSAAAGLLYLCRTLA